MKNASFEIEYPHICPKKLAIFIIVGFVLLLLSILHSKFPIFMDEALFSDIVNRFNQGLGFSTPLFKDFIPYVERFSYWYPPLYFLILSPIYLIFGAGITASRLFSLFCGTAALILVYLWSKKLFKLKYSAIIALIILATDHYFQDGSVVARMEMLTVAWGLAALIFHYQFLERKKLFLNAVSGVFSALSLMTHPTSVVILLPIGINLLFLKKSDIRKRIIILLSFSLPILLALSSWIISFWPNRDIFILQNLIQLHRKQFSPIYVIAEVFRYQPIHRVILSFYFISNLIFVVRNLLKKNFNPKTNILTLLAITSAILPIWMKEMWYLVYITIFGSIILVKNFEFLWQKGKALLALIAFTALVVLNSLVFFDTINSITSNQDNYWSFSKKISEHIPQNSRVLSASFPDPFFYLEKNRPDLELRIGPNSPHTEPIDVAVYNKIFHDVDYVVLSYYLNQHVYDYIDNNQEKIVFDNGKTGGYKVLLIKLKPLSERVELNPAADKTWTYPKLSSE